ncbi:MAG: ATP-binding protein [Bacteroidia bacterium]|nr:ATP-binding protein [Bacteroidia bacterium]
MKPIEKQNKKEFKIVITPNFEAVTNTCKLAQDHHRLECIVGYPGAGKTTTLTAYFNRNQKVYYVSAKNIMNRKQFFSEVLSKLGIDFVGTVYEMVQVICQHLNKNSGSLLIIDEAGKLNNGLLLDLHDLRNETDQTTGIIMAGCEYFKSNIERSVARQKQGIPEFYSRIVGFLHLRPPTKKEIGSICEINGITDSNVISGLYGIADYRKLYNSIMNHLLLNS